MFKEILQKVVFENTVQSYVTSLAVFFAGLLAALVFRNFLLTRLQAYAEMTETTLDDFLVKILKMKLMPLFYFGALYVSVQNLVMPPFLSRGVDMLVIGILIILGIRFFVILVDYLLESQWIESEKSPGRKASLKKLVPVLNIMIWAVGVIFLMDNLGFKVSTIIAGFGIGGIAIAFAAQAVLGDLFSYLAILLDKPFEIGDFVIIDDFKGTIEHIGIKTTRIRSLGGEQLVLSNADLTDSRLKNYKRMQQRRIVFKLGVTYSTPIEKLREIPGIIKGIIEGIELTKFDRAHFCAFGDFSLDIETAFYVLSGEYAKYMDIQQEINLQIATEFEKLGIEFAFPTQTLHIEK